MTITMSWLAALTTIALLSAYEVVWAVAQRRSPDRLARTVHATLRTEWFAEVSRQKGSEVLAVQTLRSDARQR